MATRRIDKKLHARHVSDVLVGIIDSPAWKDEVLALEVNQEIPIDAAAAGGRDDPPSRLLKRHRLRFRLRRVEPDADTEPGASLFMLVASAYPSVEAFAEEYPDAVGRPGASDRAGEGE